MIHRENMLEKGKRLPCYACKYYSKSLKSAMTRILRVPEEYPSLDKDEVKKLSACAQLFYHLRENKKQVERINENYNLLIANTLKGAGNVVLSCSNEDHTFRRDFLDEFFKGMQELYGEKKEHLKRCF